MEIFHKFEYIDGVSKIVIYVKYPDSFEFGLDFDKFNKNVKSVSNKIREYIIKNFKEIKDDTALLVLNGIVVGTIVFSSLNYLNNESSNFSSDECIIEASISNNKGNSTNAINELKAQNIDVQEDSENENNVPIIKSQVNSKSNPTTNVKNSKTNTLTSKVTINNNTSTTTSFNSIPSTKTVKVKLSSGNIVNLSLEDYVVGVVGAEMPAEFNSEALKAQAVAARTYALKKSLNNTTLTATTSDQVYKTNDQLKALWKDSFYLYYNKVKSAVVATEGVYMTYNGSYIDALYFSISNGKTEDASFVWGNNIPYLKPVDSSFDTNVRGFSKAKSISMSSISSKLGVNLNSISQINIISKTSSGRINKINICGKEFSGTKIRSLLGLRSTDFSITQSGNNIIFTTKGYGHGVGMSQYGANEMAKKGYTYQQILTHYYTGISINKL